MGKKILSVSSYEAIERYLNSFRKNIQDYYDKFSKAIEVFNNNPVAQSFYESGLFGQRKQEEIIKIKEALVKYINVIDSNPNSLIPQTFKHCEDQLVLLNSHSFSQNGNNGTQRNPHRGVVDL